MATKEFEYTVIKDFGTIGDNEEGGYETRLKLISWNGAKPKLDLRKWNKENTKMAKGVSFSIDEAYVLRQLLDDMDLSKLENMTEPEEDE